MSFTKKSKDSAINESNREKKPEMGKLISSQLAPLNISLAKKLTGSPQVFEDESNLEDLKNLMKEGIAADFGEAGWARGYLWKGKVVG